MFATAKSTRQIINDGKFHSSIFFGFNFIYKEDAIFLSSEALQRILLDLVKDLCTLGAPGAQFYTQFI